MNSAILTLKTSKLFLLTAVIACGTKDNKAKGPLPSAENPSVEETSTTPNESPAPLLVSNPSPRPSYLGGTPEEIAAGKQKEASYLAQFQGQKFLPLVSSANCNPLGWCTDVEQDIEIEVPQTRKALLLKAEMFSVSDYGSGNEKDRCSSELQSLQIRVDQDNYLGITSIPGAVYYFPIPKVQNKLTARISYIRIPNHKPLWSCTKVVVFSIEEFGQ